MISKKSLNVLFGILVCLMIICGIHIIVMISRQEIVISFYFFAGMAILCSVVYIIAFLRMRFLLKNPQKKCGEIETHSTTKDTTKQGIKESNNKSKDIIKQEMLEELDDYQKVSFLITNYLHFKSMNMNVMPLDEFDKLLSEHKLSAINFEKLNNDSNDIYKLTETQDREQNLIIQELCVPLKRAGYLDGANKVYKYIYKTYGFSQVLMNSWAKIFVCNKQFDIAYKLFELGDNQYKYRIKVGDLIPDPITTMLLGGVVTSQCYENMNRVKRAMSDYQYAIQLIKDMGGNPNIEVKNKLE